MVDYWLVNLHTLILLDIDGFGGDRLNANTFASNDQNIDSLFIGTYIVSVTDYNGCVAIDSITLSPTVEIIVNAGEDTLVCLEDSLIITGSSTGTNTPTLEWSYYNPLTGSDSTISSGSVSVDVSGFTQDSANVINFIYTVEEQSCIVKDSILVNVASLPLVDAGMRELNQTGFMHNRVRMLVGSFLCKHLLIDWRKGEKYFASKLFDYEQASNVGNWQWVAGCGVDAAPYFRIFNPVTQGQKFDPNGDYIKKYVPELKNLPLKFLFCPWECPLDILKNINFELGKDYPYPIVNLKESRERALSTYNLLRQERNWWKTKFL